ncbi:endonuclease/exonuclease/phosphatase family protein [Bifidobacterium merycicum]|uniref:endonuclease/exonuclease/phosphatase family protein n=1 Tax=Bifidobacterium merycicum TaxID=78345 RepID=UPI0023F14FE9|nr:endonuclease/exonuclease/phosphatase family protein [Bifidobacterium merycicum]
MAKGFARSRGIGIALWVVMAIVLFVMALRVMPVSFSNVECVPLIVALTPWFVIPAGIVAGIALATRRRVLAVIGLVCIVAQVCWHWGYIVPAERLSDEARQAVEHSKVDTSDRYARIMTLNTKNGLADAERLVRIVRDEHVEVLALQEVTSHLMDHLNDAGLPSLLPYANVAKRSSNDNGGINMLWSAAPMSNATDGLIPIDASSIPASSIDFGGVTVRFGSVHLSSPRPSIQGLWNGEMNSISQLRNDSGKYVLMGDFNAVWDHASFRYLLGNRFLDAGERAGSGFHMTYPANKKLLGFIPVPTFSEIDHIVHDRGVVVGDLEARNIAGSDHKALLGTLEIEAAN